MSSARPAEGEAAPDFTLPRDGGGTVALADLVGSPFVLYFYPKADTPGCTAEALDFTRLAPDFHAAGARVLAVSKDPVARQERFRDKHGLGLALLSDAGSDTAERYGVWVEQSMYGRTFWGIERTTFLLGAGGRIARVWRKVRVRGHAEKVLAAVRGL